MMSEPNHTESVVRLPVRALAFVFALLALAAPGFASSFKANVHRASMPVYASPSSSGKKLGSLPTGTEVTVVAYSGDWTKIKYKGKSGYANFKYLNAQKRIKAYSKGSYKVYTEPSTSSKLLCTVSKGTTVYVAGKTGSYYLVENKNGTVYGYIKKAALTKKKPAKAQTVAAKPAESASKEKDSAMPSSLKSSQSHYSSSLSNSKKIEHAIYVAQEQLGKPYSSSPKAPDSFDCAGLTRYCYGKAGVKLKASAYSQGYDSSYVKVKSASDLKRGDVVVFDTNSADKDLSDHTGIYLGSGSFIHASSGGGKVIVSSLSSGYYSETFSWGLRILD